MAEARVYYEIDSTMEGVCFICAVKQAINDNPIDNKIYLQSEEYHENYRKCDRCGRFIEDKISI